MKWLGHPHIEILRSLVSTCFLDRPEWSPPRLDLATLSSEDSRWCPGSCPIQSCSHHSRAEDRLWVRKRWFSGHFDCTCLAECDTFETNLEKTKNLKHHCKKQIFNDKKTHAMLSYNWNKHFSSDIYFLFFNNKYYIILNICKQYMKLYHWMIDINCNIATHTWDFSTKLRITWVASSDGKYPQSVNFQPRNMCSIIWKWVHCYYNRLKNIIQKF